MRHDAIKSDFVRGFVEVAPSHGDIAELVQQRVEFRKFRGSLRNVNGPRMLRVGSGCLQCGDPRSRPQI